MTVQTPVTSFIIATLAVWRVTHLLAAEDGPADIIVRLRRLAGNGFLGRLLDCFYCLSLWIAIPAAWLLGNSWGERMLLWLSLSGAAILLERSTTPIRSFPPPANWQEKPIAENKNKGEQNVLLR